MKRDGNYVQLTQEIQRLSIESGRPENAVQMVAVSKRRTVEDIEALMACGQKAFAESYLQEALGKIAALQASQLTWHFIGRLQSNKLKIIAEHFSWVQTVASLHHAEGLSRYAKMSLNVCIQVNINQEAQQGGVALSEAIALAEKVAALPQLTLRGVMAIGPKTDDYQQQCQQFQLLLPLYRQLAERFVTVDTFSIGMSGDFKAAIASGATLLRLGRVLFDEVEK